MYTWSELPEAVLQQAPSPDSLISPHQCSPQNFNWQIKVRSSAMASPQWLSQALQFELFVLLFAELCDGSMLAAAEHSPLGW